MAEEAVLEYLTVTDRPYSANDIVLNLHKKWTRGSVQRALDSLVEKTLVIEKVYGKQKVYVVRQREKCVGTEEESKDMDERLEKATKLYRDTEEELKRLDAQIEAYKNTMTTAEANEQIVRISGDLNALRSQLANIPLIIAPVSPEKVTKAEEENKSLTKEYKSRKRMCMDIVNAILETCPKPRKVLLEEIGIETDEDCNFVLRN